METTTDTALMQTVNSQDAFVWSLLTVAPIILTIVIHVMVLGKMAYFKERKGLKWLASLVIFILLSILKPFVTMAVFTS